MKKIMLNIDDSIYKIRLKSSDKKTGKRGGYRVIYYFSIKNNIYLIKIYL